AFLTCSVHAAAGAAQKTKTPKPAAKSKPSKAPKAKNASPPPTPLPSLPVKAAVSNAPLVINGVTITLEQVARVAPLVKFHEYEKYYPSSFDYIATNSPMMARITGPDGESLTNWVVKAAPILPEDFLTYRTNWTESTFTNNDGVFVQSYYLDLPSDSPSFSI